MYKQIALGDRLNNLKLAQAFSLAHYHAPDDFRTIRLFSLCFSLRILGLVEGRPGLTPSEEWEVLHRALVAAKETVERSGFAITWENRSVLGAKLAEVDASRARALVKLLRAVKLEDVSAYADSIDAQLPTLPVATDAVGESEPNPEALAKHACLDILGLSPDSIQPEEGFDWMDALKTVEAYHSFVKDRSDLHETELGLRLLEAGARVQSGSVFSILNQIGGEEARVQASRLRAQLSPQARQSRSLQRRLGFEPHANEYAPDVHVARPEGMALSQALDTSDPPPHSPRDLRQKNWLSVAMEKMGFSSGEDNDDEDVF